MQQTVNFSDFVMAFRNLDRANQFSHAALQLIFDFLEDAQPDYDLDVIEICCEFSELDAEEMLASYPEIDVPEDADDDETEQAIVEYLKYNTTYIGKTSAGFVFIDF